MEDQIITKFNENSRIIAENIGQTNDYTFRTIDNPSLTNK